MFPDRHEDRLHNDSIPASERSTTRCVPMGWRLQPTIEAVFFVSPSEGLNTRIAFDASTTLQAPSVHSANASRRHNRSLFNTIHIRRVKLGQLAPNEPCQSLQYVGPQGDVRSSRRLDECLLRSGLTFFPAITSGKPGTGHRYFFPRGSCWLLHCNYIQTRVALG